ncbi:MAG: winged helix-turn-helix domain-containing protein [Candidatus Thermoplasmatota archaeon]|nr:winged helix-turn-helix domain-containing protein [Candidatus Thermoplasmatota archaeon]
MFLRDRNPHIEPEAVIEAVENPHDRQILAYTQSGAVSAQDIIEATDIPKSTAYRRIQRLQELGLLYVEAGQIKAGHAIDLFRARVEMISLLVEGGNVEAHWRLNERPDERLHRLWANLAGGGS